MEVRIGKKERARLLEIINNELSNRAEWEDFWTQIVYYFCKYKYRSSDYSSNITLPTDIYNSEPALAASTFAMGLFGYLTPLSNLFFNFSPPSYVKPENVPQEHKEWLYMAERAVYSILFTSNWAEEMSECYVDFATVGIPIMLWDKHPTKGVVFTSKHVLDIAPIYNKYKELNGYIERYSKTAGQIYQEYGDRSPKAVLDDIKSNNYQNQYVLTRLVIERSYYDIKKSDVYNKKYGTYVIYLPEEHFLDENGTSELRITTARFFKDNRSDYGYGPAALILPDTKMVNSMSYSNALGAHKMVEPPLQVPEGLFSTLDLSPGGISMKAQSANADKIESIHTVDNLPMSVDMEQIYVDRIQKALYNDLFKMLMNRKYMTATEVQELVAERAPLIGPAMGRLLNSFLSPQITWILKDLLKDKVLPSPPEGLSEIDIVYSSYLAKAQYNAEVRSMITFFNSVTPILQQVPDIGILIDWKTALKDLADKMSVPPNIIRSKEELQQIAKQIAEQQARQQQVEQAKLQAETIEKASKADKNLAEINKEE